MTLVWLALTLGLVLTVASLVYATVQALEVFRGVKRLGRAANEELERISAASGEIERHLELASASGARLEASLARLRRSRAQLTVLTSALADTRASLRRLTGVVPRK